MIPSLPPALRSVDLIRKIARRQPKAIAIVHAALEITYGELIERSDRLANGLLRIGHRPGDRIGILAGNRPEYLEIYLALQIAGLVAVPINFRLVADEIRFILENSRSTGLIVAEEFLPVIAAIGDRLEGLRPDRILSLGSLRGESPYERLIAQGPAQEIAPAVPITAPATIFYTSGTTGFPKGAVLSGLNIVQRIIALGWELGIGARDVMLVPGPLFHMSFSFMAFIPLCIGGRSVVTAQFEPDEVFETMRHRSVTRSFMVPKMLSLFLDSPHVASSPPQRQVTDLLSSGSALPRQTFEGLQTIFPNVRIAESMGWTESNWIVLCPHDDLLRKPGSAGRAAFGSELAILDDDGQELPHGTIGQIHGACPVQFLGYFDNPDATAAMRRGKWETGGDVGYVDEDGFLFILDRKRDMIISGGENIYPAEIERVLQSHPDVAEVAVVGVADARWGESPRACVVLKDGRDTDEAALIAFCDGRLARYKLPRSVRFIDALPRNSMGKVLRRELRERYAQERDDAGGAHAAQ